MAAERNYFDVVTNAMENMKHVENCIRIGVVNSKNIAGDLLEIDNEAPDDQFDELRVRLLQLLKLEADITNFGKIIEDTKRQFTTGEIPANLGNIITETFQKVKQTPESTLKNHRHYKEFEKTLRENRGDTPPEEPAAAVVLHGGDIVMMQDDFIPLDPISKQEISDPVKNKICGHSYERSTIIQHIQGRKARCPIVGCRNNHRLTVNILEDDVALKERIEKKNKVAERARRM